jgi:hypothetical protein
MAREFGGIKLVIYFAPSVEIALDACGEGPRAQKRRRP